MRVESLLYGNSESKKVALKVSKQLRLPVESFKISNPMFKSLSKIHIYDQPSHTFLIGGNRWRHHYALNLTNRPMLVIDAHSDMSYDEMIVLGIPRPYNWLYFRLKRLNPINLIIQPVKKLKRFDVALPKEAVKFFKLYAFTPSSESVYVSASLLKRIMVKVENPEAKLCELKIPGKQVSVDWDITRMVDRSRVLSLLDKICTEGDTFDLWLDEGIKGNNRIEDHAEYCAEIIKTLNYESR